MALLDSFEIRWKSLARTIRFRKYLLFGCFVGTLLFLNPFAPKPIPTPCSPALTTTVKPTDVFQFNSLQQSLSQDDPRLLDLLRTKYLIRPSTDQLEMEPKSQIGKTKSSPVAKLVQELLENKTNGYYFECGALDGVFLSNTLELERNFGWTGVLVEADPKYHSPLIATNRNAWIAPVCLSPKPYPMQLKMRRHKTPGWSTIAEYHADRMKILGADKSQWQEFEVQCFPLYSVLLASLNRTEIDYLSLDVEGAEWSIIQTIPFDKVKIKVFGMEFKSGVVHQEAKKYLESMGYVYQTMINRDMVEDGVFAHKTILKPTI